MQCKYEQTYRKNSLTLWGLWVCFLEIKLFSSPGQLVVGFYKLPWVVSDRIEPSYIYFETKIIQNPSGRDTQKYHTDGQQENKTKPKLNNFLKLQNISNCFYLTCLGCLVFFYRYNMMQPRNQGMISLTIPCVVATTNFE